VLSSPKPGTRVVLHYAAARRAIAPYHGRTGTVVTPGKGRPRNHLVCLDGDGAMVIVPAGNVRAAK
jgi:hypothetical protein